MDHLYAILCVPKNFTKIEKALNVTKSSLYAVYRLNGTRILLMAKDSYDVMQLRYSYSPKSFKQWFVWNPSITNDLTEVTRMPS